MRSLIRCSFLVLAGLGCTSPVDPVGGDASVDVCAARGERCEELGTERCGEGGASRCELIEGCLVWSAPIACEARQRCREGACVECGASGTFRSQILRVGEQDRTYLLHVPDGVGCDTEAPLWVDFHGTATATPEEAYNLDDQIAIADREGAILVRPRSRSRSTSGFDLYQWDVNPGDLHTNRQFAEALLAELERRYRLSPTRRYASGFSSGTNMIAQFLEDGTTRFTGLGFIAGGVWSPVQPRALEDDALRVYAATGYRDYIHPSWRTLRRQLTDAGLERTSLFEREADAGHEQYRWHLEEMWAWLDRAARPEPPDNAGWIAEPDLDADGVTLLEAAVGPDGTVWVAGTDGAVFRRTSDGEWAAVTDRDDDGPNLTGMCLSPDGAAFAVGDGQLAVSSDGGPGLVFRPTPTGFPGAMLGAPHLNAAACRQDSVLAAGYWLAVESTDGGDRFDEVPMPNGAGGTAQVAAAAASDRTGTVVVAGYYHYIGRRPASAEGFEPVSVPGSQPWLNDVSVSPTGDFWVVGDRGAVFHSDDDGVRFDDRSLPDEVDLYAVAAGPVGHVVAVGSHGAAFVSEDQGRAWTALPTGQPGFLGDVVFIAPTTVLAVGEDGVALTLSL